MEDRELYLEYADAYEKLEDVLIQLAWRGDNGAIDLLITLHDAVSEHPVHLDAVGMTEEV